MKNKQQFNLFCRFGRLAVVAGLFGVGMPCVEMQCGLMTQAVAMPMQDAVEEATQEKAEQKEDAKPEELVDIVLADGRIDLKVPKAWEKKKPKFNIVEAEFAPKPVKAKTEVARLTVMASGGSIEQNVDRWKGQFSQEDDSSTSEHTKQKQEKVNGMVVHLVDITGTYADSAGPFAGNAVERENYRMIAAVVETKVAGNYFFKLYGPKETVAENEKRFLQMIKSIKISL